MNQINSTIAAEPTLAHQVDGSLPPSARPGSGLVVHHHRDGGLLRTSKSGEINPHLVCLLQPTSFLAESYFRLRHTLELMRKQERGLVLGVTSPGAGDGKTLTAINLAGALAQDAHARVLLVDLNLRQSGASVRNYLDLQPDTGSGVSDWIGNDAGGQGLASYHLPGINLHLIPPGTNVDSPYELLKSPRLDELFEQARQQYDYIIVDTPQTLLLPDIELIARVVDSFLIVVRANSTPRERLAETLNLMQQEKVLGLVFNESPAHR
jgi:capsular exopolysaccharide synthesis family protein